jgi:hypothetical protein
VWSKVKQGLGLHDVDPSSWYAFGNVEEWWMEAIHKQRQAKKAMVSLGMLVSWEIWKERNTRIFQNTASSSIVMINKIKEEVAL